MSGVRVPQRPLQTCWSDGLCSLTRPSLTRSAPRLHHIRTDTGADRLACANGANGSNNTPTPPAASTTVRLRHRHRHVDVASARLPRESSEYGYTEGGA